MSFTTFSNTLHIILSTYIMVEEKAFPLSFFVLKNLFNSMI
jgi:hypothetical protein